MTMVRTEDDAGAATPGYAGWDRTTAVRQRAVALARIRLQRAHARLAEAERERRSSELVLHRALGALAAEVGPEAAAELTGLPPSAFSLLGAVDVAPPP